MCDCESGSAEQIGVLDRRHVTVLPALFLDRDFFGVVGVKVLEALGEFVGVVEDVLD